MKGIERGEQELTPKEQAFFVPEKCGNSQVKGSYPDHLSGKSFDTEGGNRVVKLSG